MARRDHGAAVAAFATGVRHAVDANDPQLQARLVEAHEVRSSVALLMCAPARTGTARHCAIMKNPCQQ